MTQRPRLTQLRHPRLAWAALPFSERARLLLTVADILEARRSDFVAALTSECGGWIGKGLFETRYTPGAYRAAATAAYFPSGETMPSDHQKTSIVVSSTLRGTGIALSDIFTGALPFAWVMVLVTLLLVFFPTLAAFGS